MRIEQQEKANEDLVRRLLQAYNDSQYVENELRKFIQSKEAVLTLKMFGRNLQNMNNNCCNTVASDSVSRNGKNIPSLNRHHDDHDNDLILVPIALQHREEDILVHAEVDSGAKVTFIDSTLVKELRLPVISAKGNVTLAVRSEAAIDAPPLETPRLGNTGPVLTMYYGGKKLEGVSCEIAHLDGVKLIIGRDLMPQLGIGITGLIHSMPTLFAN